MAKVAKLERGHTVVLIHGIRTHAGWYQRAEEVFSSIEGVEVEAIKYGRFDLVRFLVPGPWRRGPVDRTERALQPILRECERRGRMVTIIAHSNGTNVIAQILKLNNAIEIDNLIMCGAVVDTHYDWRGIMHKVKGRIINDYGVRDIWPAVAHSISWGYGYSGTNGIGSPVDDRLHNSDHSSYFDREFIETYWASLLRDGTFTKPRYGGTEPVSPWWFGVFEFPWKWVFLATFAALAIWAIVPGLGSEPTSNTIPTLQPMPDNSCSDLMPLSMEDWRQTQISESAFERARVRTQTFYIKVREDSDVESEVICEIGPNVVFDAYDYGDGWAMVRLATGHLGFMRISGIERIR